MTSLTIENKKFVLLSEKDYKSLQKKAALKQKTERPLSVEEARTYSKTLIKKWASEK